MNLCFTCALIAKKTFFAYSFLRALLKRNLIYLHLSKKDPENQITNFFLICFQFKHWPIFKFVN